MKRKNSEINVGNIHACYSRHSHACEIFIMQVKVFVLHVNFFYVLCELHIMHVNFFTQVKQFGHACGFLQCVWTIFHTSETLFVVYVKLFAYIKQFCNACDFFHVSEILERFPPLYTVRQIHTSIFDIKTTTSARLQFQQVIDHDFVLFT